MERRTTPYNRPNDDSMLRMLWHTSEFSRSFGVLRLFVHMSSLQKTKITIYTPRI